MNKNKMMFYKILGYVASGIFCFLLPMFVLTTYGFDPYIDEEDFYTSIIIGFVVPMLIYYIVYVLSTILHELGHLIMGLFEKMEFKEFNFIIFSIYKENDKIKFKIKKLGNSVVGFCSMEFPDNLTSHQFAMFSYGGIIANIILILIGYVLFKLFDTNISKLISLCTIFMNLGFTITNLIPYEVGNGIDTDGMKIYKVRNDINYIKCISNQEKISKLLKEGKSIVDIPDNLIYKPNFLETSADLYMMNLYLSKIIYEKRFEEALNIINDFLSNNNKVSKNLKNILKVSLLDIYLETDKYDLLKEVYDKDLFSYLSFLSKFDSSCNIYVLLYYLLNEDNKNIDKTIIKLNKYFSSCDMNSFTNKENYRIYNLIKEHYNIKE